MKRSTMAMHDDTHEVGKPIHRHRHPHERLLPLFVEPPHPRRDRRRRQQKRPRGLRRAPAASRAEPQDREPLVSGMPRTLLSRNAREPRVLDADLLAKQRDLLLEPVDAAAQPHACEAAVCAPRARPRERDVRQRGELHDRGARHLRPTARQFRMTMHPPRVARDYRARRASPARRAVSAMRAMTASRSPKT